MGQSWNVPNGLTSLGGVSISGGSYANLIVSVLNEIVGTTFAAMSVEEGLTDSFTKIGGANSTIIDASGKLWKCKDGEIRMGNMLRVENLLPDSEDFSNATHWINAGTVPALTAGSTTLPPNVGSSWVFTDNSSSGIAGKYTLMVTDELSSYTYSAYIKKAGASESHKVALLVYCATNDFSAGCALDAFSGAINDLNDDVPVYYTAIPGKYSVEDYNSDWWRLQFTLDSTIVGHNSVRFYLMPVVSKSGDGKAATGSHEVCGAQLEQGTTASEYISNGVLSAPFHGYGVDGVKYVAPPTTTTDLNTVLLINGEDDLSDATGKVVTINGDTALSSTQAKFGSNSIYFDGTGDYLEIASSNDFGFGTDDFTMEAWIYPTITSGSNQIFDLRSVNNEPLSLYIPTGNIAVFDGSSNIISASQPTNNWYHIALVREGNTLTLYRNGVVLGTTSFSGDLRSSNTLLIGNNWNLSNFFNGYMEDIRITKGIARYTAAFTPPTAPLEYIHTVTYDDPYILLEDVGTNLLPESLDITHADWRATLDNSSETTNGSGLLPVITDGSDYGMFANSLPKRVILDLDGGSSSSDRSGFSQTVTVLSGEDYIVSAYVKPLSSTTISDLEQIDTFCYLAALANSNESLPSEDLGNGWYKVKRKINTGATGGRVGFQIRGDDAVDTLDFVLFGVQLELADSASTFIPTTGSAVTRTAEQLSFDASASNVPNDISILLDAEVIHQAENKPLLGIIDDNGTGFAPTLSTGASHSFGVTDRAANIQSNTLTPNRTKLALTINNAMQTLLRDGYVIATGTTDYDALEVTYDADPHAANVVLDIIGESDLLDSTGKTVTVNGNTALSSTQKKYGSNSIYFDGTGDYLTTPVSPFNMGSDDFTLECWVRPTIDYNGHTDHGYLISSRDKGFTLLIGKDAGNIAFGCWDSSGPTGAYISTGLSGPALSVDTWYHVAVTREGSVFRLFLDGVEEATMNSATAIGSSTEPNLSIGRYGLQTNAYFHGYMQNIRITKGVARYTSNFTPTLHAKINEITIGSDDVANTPIKLYDFGLFDAQTDTVMKEQTALVGVTDPYRNNVALLIKGEDNLLDTTGKTVTVNGDVALSSTQKKFGTNSIYFDGTGDYLEITSSTDFGFGTGDFTIEGWFYFDSLSGNSALINLGANFELYCANTSLTVWNGSSNAIQHTVTTGQWYHVVVVCKSGLWYLYVDGVDHGNTTQRDLSSSQACKIGQNVGSSYYFNGYMEDIRITKGVARYTEAFTPPTEALSL